MKSALSRVLSLGAAVLVGSASIALADTISPLFSRGVGCTYVTTNGGTINCGLNSRSSTTSATTDTIAATDMGQAVYEQSTSALTVTVPAMTPGQHVDIQQDSSVTVTIVPASGVVFWKNGVTVTSVKTGYFGAVVNVRGSNAANVVIIDGETQ